MRIDLNFAPQEPLNPDKPGKPGSRSSAEVTGSGTSGADQAHISAGAARVKALEAEVSNMPEVRRDRVESLRRALDAGTYEVKPEQVASAMFSELMTVRPGR